MGGWNDGWWVECWVGGLKDGCRRMVGERMGGWIEGWEDGIMGGWIDRWVG